VQITAVDAQIARGNNLNIVPVFSNATGGEFDPKRVHIFLNDTHRQTVLIHQLRLWVEENKFQGINIDFWVIGLQVLGVSSLAAAFNFITTIINLRAPGMTLMRMPMFTWMAFVVQLLLVFALPVVTVAL